MADESDEEKTEEASEYKLEEARRKGQVASSKELSAVLVLAASFFAMALSLVFIYEQLGSFLRIVYSTEIDKAFTEKGLHDLFMQGAIVGLKCAAPIGLVSMLVGIFADVIQVGFLYAPEVLELKFERLDPLAGFKRLFSVRALVTTLKSLLKFVIVLSIAYVMLKSMLPRVGGFFELDIVQSFLYGKMLVVKVVFSIITGLVAVAAGDYAYEKYAYRKQMMMTKDQAKREHKERDGNPEIKQRIKAIQREMAAKRMMNDVKKADVIVTNPTHFSVALKYDGEKMISPIVIAKGSDDLAMRIRKVATEAGIPLVENVPLARALYSTVKVGETVPRNLYKAVAEVLAFIYKLKKKKKALE